MSIRYDHFAAFLQFERFAGFVDQSADADLMARYFSSGYILGCSSFLSTEVDYFPNLD